VSETQTQFYQLVTAPVLNSHIQTQLDLSLTRPTTYASDYSIHRLTAPTIVEPFRLSLGPPSASSVPAIQLARPSPAREQPNQWIPMPATSRPTITLQNPAQNQTTRLRISPPARQQTSHVPRPVVFPPTADRRASLPSTSSSSSSSQSNFVRRSTSPSVGANTSSTWKSRQPMECDFCNKMFSNKFNLKQVSSFLNPIKNGKVSQSANV
jgi:hypothetical protein